MSEGLVHFCPHRLLRYWFSPLSSQNLTAVIHSMQVCLRVYSVFAGCSSTTRPHFPKFSHTTLLLRSPLWLPIAARVTLKTLMLAYKAKNGSAPPYIKAFITPHTVPHFLQALRYKEDILIQNFNTIYSYFKIHEGSI